MRKLFFLLVASLGLGVSCVYAVPDWVKSWAENPALGTHEMRNRCLMNWYTFDLKNDDKTVNRQRIVILVGGSGNFGDARFATYRSGSDRMTSQSGWLIRPNKKIETTGSDQHREYPAHADFELYSDNVISAWEENNVEVGSIFIVEYTLATDRAINTNNVYLEDPLWDTDSTIVEVTAGDPSALSLKEMNVDSARVQLTPTAARAGHFARWEHRPFEGGYLESGARIDYEYRAAKEDGLPLRTWADVVKACKRPWDKLSRELEQVNTDYTPPIATLLADYESQFRYVAIEIGKGGWVPHRPRDVQKTRYGDCKDLSFYLTTLFSLYHIEIYPVLVHTRYNGPFDPDCPTMYNFNHCITAWVVGKDTTYYDPTARGYAPGVLPWADQGTYGLWLKEGSELVTLPLDTIPLNRVLSLTGSLDQNGGFQGDVSFQLDPRESSTMWTHADAKRTREILEKTLRPGTITEMREATCDTALRQFRAKVSLANSGTLHSGTLYWTPYPAASIWPDSAGRGAPCGYFLPRPLHYTVDLKVTLPDSASAEGFADRSDLDVGSSNAIIQVSNGGIEAHWTHEFREAFYPKDKKPQLDSLLTAISKQTEAKVKLVFP